MVVDIGGTWTRIKTDKLEKIRTEKDVFAKIMKKALENNEKIIKISFAGQVENGIIKSAPNIDVKNFNVKEYFEKYGINVKIDNDLKCAVRAESEYFKSRNIIAIYCGTGLGMGAIINGALIKGAHNLATEIGHIPYKKAPFKCGCGKNDCVELFASGSGLEKWCEYENIKFQSLEKLKNTHIFKNFLNAFSFAISTAIILFNPQIAVLGGGVVLSNKWLLDELRLDLPKFTNCEIKLSGLENPCLKGAELL
jgi:glucokinase